MILHSVPVVVLASVSGLVGVFFLFVYLRYPKDHTWGSFALVCFAIVLYDIGCIGLYNSTDVPTSAEWQRLQFMAIALLTITLSFFYHNLTGRISPRMLVIITGINIGFIIIGYAVKSHLTLSPDYPAEKVIAFGGMLNIRYLEAQPGLIYNLQVVFALVIYTICLFGLFKFQRSAGHGKTAVVLGMIIFYFGAINDALVGMGLISLPYLFEYAFAALIVSMAAILVNDFLNLHDQVENMNLTLEETVRERTRDLKVLKGLLPICASCKKIRDDTGYWNQIESYIHEHSHAEFSHSICPECVQKLYPELNLDKYDGVSEKGEETKPRDN